MKRGSVIKQNSISSGSDTHETAPLVRSYRVSDVTAVRLSDLILPINHIPLEEIEIPDQEYLGSTESIIRKKVQFTAQTSPVFTRKKKRKLSSRKSIHEIRFAPSSQIEETENDFDPSEEEMDQIKVPAVKFEPQSPKMSAAKKRWIKLAL